MQAMLLVHEPMTPEKGNKRSPILTERGDVMFMMH